MSGPTIEKVTEWLSSEGYEVVSILRHRRAKITDVIYWSGKVKKDGKVINVEGLSSLGDCRECGMELRLSESPYHLLTAKARVFKASPGGLKDDPIVRARRVEIEG